MGGTLQIYKSVSISNTMNIGTNLNSGGGGALFHTLRAQYHSQIYRINLIVKPIYRARRVMHSLAIKHENQSKPSEN